jgi:hypothetical protein
MRLRTLLDRGGMRGSVFAAASAVFAEEFVDLLIC